MTNLNVAIATPNFINPSEVFIYRQIIFYNANVIALNNIEGDKPDFNKEAIFLNNSKLLKQATNKKFNAVMLFVRKLKKLGLLPHQTWKKEWTEKSISFLKKTNTNFIIAQYGTMGISMYESAEKLNIPMAVIIWGFDASRFLAYKKYVKELKMLSKNPKVLFLPVSNKLKENLANHGIKPANIKVFPCAVPTNDFIVPTQKSIEYPIKFIFVGRLTPKKEPTSLLKAFDYAADIFNNIELHLAGDGPEYEAVQKIYNSSKHKNKINLYGVVSNSKVKELMATCHVYVQHSVTAKDGDMEGWPVSIGEAMASGLPIISTRHSGIMDQVDEGINGYLVDEHDWKGMGMKMVELAKSIEKIKQFGLESRRIIEERGDFTKVNTEMRNWFEEILNA